MNIKGEVAAMVGFAGAALTLWLGMMWAPSVSISAFKAPEAQRIFYWHVPSAWAAMIAFGMLFVGSIYWFFKRSEWAWRLHVASSEAGLATGLMCITSGCIWGAAEWGVPWDFQDVRLNSFAVLAGIALFVALGEMNSEDTEQKRDTLSSVGIFGFGLVPLTYMATRWWQERHPGPLIGGGSEDSGVDPSILLIWMIGAASMQVLFVGQALMTNRLLKTEQQLENLLSKLEDSI